jgi:hypothetical protein
VQVALTVSGAGDALAFQEVLEGTAEEVVLQPVASGMDYFSLVPGG